MYGYSCRKPVKRITMRRGIIYWICMQRISLAAILFMIFMSWACHERIIVYPPPRIPDIPSPRTGEDSSVRTSRPSPVDAPKPSKVIAEPEELVKAEDYFGRGEYPQAIREYEAYLGENSQFEFMDRILFNIGLSHALASGSDRSLSGAKDSLNRLLEEFPGSRYRSEASLILNLIAQVERLDRNVRGRNSQINRLEEELKRLKEIDLKRRPSRPTGE